MSDFGNYRRDLAVLESSGGRLPKIQQTLPSATNSPNQIAPWMSMNGTGEPSPGFGTSFYNDSSDNLSQASALSPVFRPGTGLTGNTIASTDSTQDAYGDERRPSVASVTTASSSGSKSSSMNRGGIHKKLQTFFGEDLPSRDASDTSLPLHGKEQKDRHAKDIRSNSFARSTRERNLSSATARDASPSDSRPRTPIPSSDVVPFLYQEAQDISKYGEAPVRANLSGPDRDRYVSDGTPNIPRSSSTSKSGHSHVHLPGHNHRHHKSGEDSRALRPTLSREESSSSTAQIKQKERAPTTMGTSLNTSSNVSLARPSSPTPSGWSQNTINEKRGAYDGSTSPTSHHSNGKRNLLSRFRKNKEKDSATQRLKELPGSVKSFNSSSRPDGLQDSPPFGQWGREPSLANSEINLPREKDGAAGRPANNQPRQGTYKLPFTKRRANKQTEDQELYSDASERNESFPGSVFNLDTNLSNMDGILAKPPPLTPLDNSIFSGTVDDEAKLQIDESETLGWNAPDSWAVKKINDDNMSRLPEIDEAGVPPKADDKSIPYCIRIFRIDGTFATISTNLNATVTEVMAQLGKKTYMTDSIENYQIVMKKHDLQRILGAGERPVVIQKRLLEQAGYEERDRIEDVGREDNSYLCRFSFVPARESGYAAAGKHDPGLGRGQKYSHVDLQGRNLITIPISLYSKAPEIISLNLSRNLSLDLPKDFIQSCQNLRDIKFINNEAWKLPPSLSRANRLTILDVSNNRLEQLEHAELSRLHGLISLKLANNRLTELPTYFGQFRSMRTLNVSSNFLDSFPEFLCSLESLVDIDMSFNSISNLPNSIGQLRNLERFVITNNRLAGSLPQTFSQLVQLKEVDIRYNGLSSIDVIAQLPKVEQISADHNSVSVCETEFTSIRVLRLNSNPVTKFEIKNLVPSITTLVLSNAKLAVIPDAVFDRMPNLVKLILDKNHFVSLPSHIGKLRKLEHFSIARNSLSSLPSEIGCLTELRFLDLRQNNLKKLPTEIWWANKLETFNISSNVLDSFPKPGSRPPQVPGDTSPPAVQPEGSNTTAKQIPPQTSNFEELGPLEGFGQRRPSQASSGLLSVGGSPVPDRQGSLVSVYGKGRKTSVVSRSASESTIGTIAPSAASVTRKDSGMSSKLVNTFAGSLRNLYVADNNLDDDVFDELILLSELRILNLSYNYLNDMPQRSIKSWPQLAELYLSGNELTSLPSDDFEEFSVLKVLHINGNKFQTLPAELGKAHKLAVLDCGSNSLKYNVSNWPYDWNWNWNTNLKYLNLSGNKRLEIKPAMQGSAARDGKDLTDFSALQHLRILGLMDVTLTVLSILDETEDRRVRTSGSLAGQLAYGMADTLGKNEHLSIIDMVVPRFNSIETETLLGMFDGQALSSGGSKIAKYLHENFGHIFSDELRKLNPAFQETPVDALRRAFLSLNKDLATAATQHTEERSLLAHRGSAAPAVLSQSDLHSGAVATVMFLQQSELYVANVGDAQAMLIHSEGGHRILTRKHDPAEPNERQRIRDAGGWVSRQGKLNDILEVSRAFGYVQIMPAVQAAPHITQVTVKEQDEMILIASRELWEYLSPEMIVDIARSERTDLMRAAQRLRDHAIAFGATNKIMVMMIGVSDLKKRAQIRPHRVQSLSFNPSAIVDEGYTPAKRAKKKGDGVEDSMLRRLDAEVQAPEGDIGIVFTDIKSSTLLWETFPQAMRSAIKLHNEVMRRQLRIIGGYEVKTEGDAFMVSFPTATSALLWCFSVQSQLLEVQWPSEVLNSVLGQEIYDSDKNLIFKGLSVRMGIHWGHPVCENDPVTRRMDYFGPMVNRASRISSVADGGQITVSADFISEIQRCLETYSESDRSGSTGSEDTFDSDLTSQAIRRELRSLSSQGFEVKDIGERKLKGLENPEYIYLMYPHALSGRIQYQQRLQEEPATTAVANDLGQPASISGSSQLSIDTEAVWALWNVSLRLEMLCYSLEQKKGDGEGTKLQPPETTVLEKMKYRGGEVTDRFLVNFLTHQVSRIETCVSTLAIRHLANGSATLQNLDQLRDPMSDIISGLAEGLKELQRYKEKYGALDS
ncbi:adenylate cyclase [Coleophoma crateriformis]|uniref:Adenylate cyclase n=1 Tax=Coleophoma crateriformis TaxID=565419 RepID=A0A3D8RVG7_9HELO|nr:adenylate cyclase [Coleophoma crateriformis]